MITEPRYYRALDGILQDKTFTSDTSILANYFSMNYLLSNDDFIGGETKKIIRQIKSKKFKRFNDDYQEAKQGCVDFAQSLMPYGTGYIYIKAMSEDERNAIRDDVNMEVNYIVEEFLKNVDALTWMTPVSAFSILFGYFSYLGWKKSRPQKR